MEDSFEFILVMLQSSTKTSFGALSLRMTHGSGGLQQDDRKSLEKGLIHVRLNHFDRAFILANSEDVESLQKLHLSQPVG